MTEPATGAHPSSGFTLLELLIVVGVIGVIAAIAVGILSEQTEKAMVTAVAADLKTFESGFLSYAADQGDFPPDSHLDGTYHLPPGAGVEDYLPVERWASETPLGGNYNWEGPDFYPYAGVSVFQPSAPASTFALLDKTLDDGDLSQGKFRVGTNGRYTYVIDE
jgi:prepilin-type N-terminal cleavage/methylation domain-containing protein